jgi:chromosome partition protein MukE
MTDRWARLEEVVLDPLFAELDLDLREGVHVSSDDIERYAFLQEARPHLERFYEAYRCRLVFAPEQYVYLLPEGDRLRTSKMTRAEMLVGQVLALLYRDPGTLETRGVIRRELVTETLQHLLGDRLADAVLGHRTSKNAEIAGERVRADIRAALQSLRRLGFVDLPDDDHVALRTTLMRFTDPVRRAQDLDEALRNLVARGEIVQGVRDDGQ